MQWTGGSVWLGRVALAVLVAGVVAGPAAMVITLAAAKPTAPAPTAFTAAPKDEVLRAGAAGEQALGTVVSWLASTSKTPSLSDTGQVSWPDQPAEVSSARVAVVKPGPAEGTYQVLVAVSAPAGVRYYSVPVATTAGADGAMAATALALPVPAAQPPSATRPPAAYPVSDLDRTSALAATVSGFVTAYVTGADLTRYTRPGRVLVGLSPGLYTGATVTRLDAAAVSDHAQRELAAPIAPEGASVRVLARFTLLTAAGRDRPADLALTLGTRDGRWEISAIDPVPALGAPPGSAPATSSPAGTPAPTSTASSALTTAPRTP